MQSSCSPKAGQVKNISEEAGPKATFEKSLKLSSESMKMHNPLLPNLEKKLWEEMLKAEQNALNGSEKGRLEFISLAKEITDRHPFKEDKGRAVLGGVVWNKTKNYIEFDAVTKYPQNDDYVELVLCNKNGRQHETLFVTAVRPLHMEIMLHFSGCDKGTGSTIFRIFIALPGNNELPLEAFVKGDGEIELPDKLSFYFSGSPYLDNNYKPDLNGDHIIFWDRHDAVLQSTDSKIKSGNTKIKINRNSVLPENTPVKIRLKKIK